MDDKMLYPDQNTSFEPIPCSKVLLTGIMLKTKMNTNDRICIIKCEKTKIDLNEHRRGRRKSVIYINP